MICCQRQESFKELYERTRFEWLSRAGLSDEPRPVATHHYLKSDTAAVAQVVLKQ